MKWIGWAAWLILLVFIFSGKWLFPDRWQRYLMRTGELAVATADCATEKDNEYIEVAEANADRLFTEGFSQVLVAKDEGCYRLHQIVKLFSIQRTAKTKQVFRRREWANVKISMVIESDFKNLEPGRRFYARQKFGAEAFKMNFHLVTLAVVAGSPPIAPPIFERQHPGAKALLASRVSQLLREKKDAIPVSFAATQIAGVSDAQVLKLPPTAFPVSLVDPEDYQFEHSIDRSELAKIPPNKTVIVIAESDIDARAYNLVTLLMLRGQEEIYLVTQGLKNSYLLPEKIAGLESVDCWKTIELINAGATYGRTVNTGVPKIIWFGQNEMDLAYLKSIQSQLTPGKNKTGTKGYWFRGGLQHLDWCRKHMAGGMPTEEDDI